MRRKLVGAAICLLSACGQQGEQTAALFNETARQSCPRFYAQISNQPEHDANARLQQGDRRVLAMLQPGFLAPGLSDERTLGAMTAGPSAYRTLAGLEDAVGPESCLEFTIDAPRYMERYNREIILNSGDIAGDSGDTNSGDTIPN